MRASWLRLTAAALLLAGASPTTTPPSVPPTDAPALALLGKDRVGIRTLTVPGAAGRTLRVVLWYPASAAAGARPAPYKHLLRPPPPLKPLQVTTAALASPNAPPVPGAKPLVVLSHGYGGWPESMSYLAENLASKGYVVAGIDHQDLPFTDAAGFRRSFGLTVATRARDQQAVIAALADPRFASSVDPNRVALIGYSMGGFGALATAGAGYDPLSPIVRDLPAGALEDQLAGKRRAEPRLKALVAIAPWGAQAPHRAWSTDGLKALRVPMLVITGDQDDVSGYRDGIGPLFEAATGTERHLLTYRNARHNVGGNPSPTEAREVFALRELFDEPVWRSDRLNAINQHFVTAFLDLHLKDLRERETFLRAPWPGFQPRWNLGFEMKSSPATTGG
jgi:dienelactone hydrolase